MADAYAVRAELQQHHLRAQRMRPLENDLFIGRTTECGRVFNRRKEKIGDRQYLSERCLRLAQRPQSSAKIGIKRSTRAHGSRLAKQRQRGRTSARRDRLRDAAGVNKLRPLHRCQVNIARRQLGRGRPRACIAELMPGGFVMHKVPPGARVLVHSHLRAIYALTLPQITQPVAKRIKAHPRDVAHTRALPCRSDTKISGVSPVTQQILAGLGRDRIHLPHRLAETQNVGHEISLFDESIYREKV